MDKKSALALVAELENQNYLKPLGNGAYEFTDKGEELVRASAAGKISRKTAEEALAGLLERVKQYNSDTTKILTVEAVVNLARGAVQRPSKQAPQLPRPTCKHRG